MSLREKREEATGKGSRLWKQKAARVWLGRKDREEKGKLESSQAEWGTKSDGQTKSGVVPAENQETIEAADSHKKLSRHFQPRTSKGRARTVRFSFSLYISFPLMIEPSSLLYFLCASFGFYSLKLLLLLFIYSYAVWWVCWWVLPLNMFSFPKSGKLAWWRLFMRGFGLR